MKCAMYYNNRDVRLEEIPIPEIGPDELLVKMRACGLCGSDVLEWYRLKKAPLVLGHEMTGDIAAVGKNVTQYSVGDRVFVSHHVPCNTCRYCLNGHHTVCDTLRTTNFDPGGFAEFIRVPKINVDRGVFPLPDELSYEQGTFIEPLACVLRGQRVANLQPTQTVFVIGGGIAGLLHLKAAHALGASSVAVTDVHEKRLAFAKRLSAQATFLSTKFTPDHLRELYQGRLADLVVVATGAIDAIDTAWKCTDRGGTVLVFAPPEPGIDIAVPLYDIWNDGVTITTTYAGSPLDITRAIELLRTKTIVVDDMITHRLPLARAAEGFALVENAQDSLKVMIEP
jgi:L-iditol 2-dehydrogenase